MNQPSPKLEVNVTIDGKPIMTTLAGRPVKVLYAPDADILVSCRTASGEDVSVPATALMALFEHKIINKLRTIGGSTHGS